MTPKPAAVDVVIGDLFESPAQTLVNTVNCVGVMGKGVALEFKKRFPDMFEDYARRCARGEVKLGQPYLYRTLLPPYVLNFPTKDDWRAPARLEDIVAGLEYLEAHFRDWGITSLAVPPLGCGQGGLDWSVIGPTLYNHLQRLGVPVHLYAPYGTPHEELEPRHLQRTLESRSVSNDPASLPMPRMEPAWVALVAALHRVESDPHHWPIGKVSFQKLAYFATATGLPTGLSFTKGRFGPYAPGLTGVMNRLANNGLITHQRLGRMSAVRVGSTFGDAERTHRDALEQWSSEIERVADLFARFPKTRDAEVAASIHFVASSLEAEDGRPPSEDEVLVRVLDWKRDKRPALHEDEIVQTMRILAMLGWLKLAPGDPDAIDQVALAGL
jgi:O-acetyl-ADP-ribose deacetylase (regulator of RNase III)/uncharacterized protein YwgA